MAELKDSGERREFGTGAVRDRAEGKGRCDLLPLNVVSSYLKTSGADIKEVNIIACIDRFQETKDVVYLYSAICIASEYWDSLYSMLLDVAKHFEDGARKYSPDNWRRGIPIYCYIDSAVRHFLKWRRGDDDEPHDRAFIWNLMCCIWETNRQNENSEVTEVNG